MAVHGCSMMNCNTSPTDQLPAWVPSGARLYLSHVATGQSLRAIARAKGCHPSTILRQIRRFENRRDDPLIDNALNRLDRSIRKQTPRSALHRPKTDTESQAMSSKPCLLPEHHSPEPLVTTEVEAQARSFLAHLTRPRAMLIVASDMPKAVITCDTAEGIAQRLAVLDRHIAEAMALLDWISCESKGRVSSYVISAAGRAESRDAGSAAEASHIMNDNADETASRRMRYGYVESPITVLARRRDKSGAPFLDPRQVQAAERLREDFAMAQLDSIDWACAQELLKALETRRVPGGNIAPPGTKAARKRVLEVFRDLGPGLGDVTLRCCCRLEGVESVENALGWSARSGKIVLRIALQRMARLYQRLSEVEQLIG